MFVALRKNDDEDDVIDGDGDDDDDDDDYDKRVLFLNPRTIVRMLSSVLQFTFRSLSIFNFFFFPLFDPTFRIHKADSAESGVRIRKLIGRVIGRISFFFLCCGRACEDTSRRSDFVYTREELTN